MTKLSYDEVIEKIGDHLIFVSEADRWDDEFRPPATYFIVNAMGEAVFFRTRDRLKAQTWADMLYGKNFYIVNKALKAAIR